jgi:hypothetical protein
VGGLTIPRPAENSEEFPQLQASPIHVSQPDPPPASRPPSSFEAAFPNTRPSERVRAAAAQGWRVPRSLCRFWQENIQESLRTFDIPSENIYSPICMTPTSEQVARMYARSKCMELLPPKHPSLLLSPTKGQPLCFLARAGEGLPIHIQQALFFFASVSHSLVDMAHFAAPTTATNVVVRSPCVPACQKRLGTDGAEHSTTGATPG